MPTITCHRCQESKEPLPEPPVGGELGAAIVAGICPACWDEWRTTSAQLINHHGLNMGLPEHRQQLRTVMKEFLKLA
jgi:Fe-S cluster biosynthesis and repair protein YggX